MATNSAKAKKLKKVLVYGIGNPARQDDGLGPAFIARLEKEKLNPLVDLDANYQLQVEDALLFSEYQTVILVDALKKGQKHFIWKKIRPGKNSSFTTHALSPQAVAHLCAALYGKKPEIFLLGIRGYEFEVQEGLTTKAQANLEKALAFFKSLFQCDNFKNRNTGN